MRSRRGQEGAPVELVVAVIILLASMVIALRLIQQTGEAQCISQVKAQVDKLKIAMQDLALQSPPSSRTISFEMPSCGSTSVDVLRFVYYKGAGFCRACAGHFDGCWKLELASFDPTSGHIVQNQQLLQSAACIDIAGKFTIYDGHAFDPTCIQLGDNPCPVYAPDSSPYVKTPHTGPGGNSYYSCSGDALVPDNVLQNSAWQTLGRYYDSAGKNTRFYDIQLTKSTYSEGPFAELGAIQVCARPING